MKLFAMKVRLESPAFDPAAVHVAQVSGQERISRLFEFELHVSAPEDTIDEDALLTHPATLLFERKDTSTGAEEVRRVPGIVRMIRDRPSTQAKRQELVLTFVPRAWRATLSTTADVCMDLSIPDILQKKLKEGAGLDAGADIALRLMRTYTPKEFVVQYKESHLDFVSRLAEDLGIHFFFEEENGREVMVFGDENSSFHPSLPATVPFTPRGELTHVYELEGRRQLVTRHFAARDYNYRNPAMEVIGEAETTALGAGKFDEYGPHARTPEEATLYARLRAEEAAVRSFTFEGRSDLPGIRAGSIVKVENHPRGELELVVIEVVHEFRDVLFFGEGEAATYVNTFVAIPKSVVYRPARLTPKPVVHGVVTGLVEAEASTKLGAVDDQGRYRVAFMYDSVTGRGDGKASRPLRMAQPSASADRGFHVPLKIGTEVIITCVNGDPDRPIITGAVPNPQTPSPVTSSNSEKSIWQTNVNQIAIDDSEPRCKISVEDDHTINMGQPDAPEVGICIGTTKNVTEVANEQKTESSKEKSVYTEELTVLAAKLIVQCAGVPNPLSLWEKKFKEVKAKVEEFAKKASEFTDKFMNDYENTLGDVSEDLKEAKEAYEQTVDALKEKSCPVGEPQPTLDMKSGQPRMETQEEADERAFQESLDDDGKKVLDAAIEKVEDAQHLADDVKPVIEDVKKKAPEIAKKWEEKVKDVQKVGEDLAKGNFSKYAKKYAPKIPGKAGEIADSAIKVLEESGNLKKIEEAIKKSAGGKKLISVLSKVFSKAADEAFDKTVKASQALAAASPKASGERHAASVGTFGTPHNIQLSRDSAALYAVKDTFVFGGKNATVHSPLNTSITAQKRVDVKARSLVEIAAKLVAITGSKIVDVHATKQLRLVAHDADKKFAMPGGHTMYLHSKEGIMLDSMEKDIEAKAKKNIKLEAQEENFELVAKQAIRIKAKDKEIDLTAEKGKIEIHALDGQTSVRAKKKIVVECSEGDFTVKATKGKGTIQAQQGAVNIDSKGGKWESNGDLLFNAKKGSTFTVKATKVELG